MLVLHEITEKVFYQQDERIEDEALRKLRHVAVRGKLYGNITRYYL